MDLAAGELWQMRAIMATSDQIGINVTHWLIVDPGTPPRTDAQFALACETQVAASYKALIGASATFKGCSVYRVLPEPATLPAVSGTLAGVGTLGGDLLPKQTCGVVTWTTIFAGPAYRGRIYVPFPAEAGNDADSTPTAGYLASLNALAVAYNNFVAFTAGGVTATIQQVLRHGGDVPIVPTPITSYIVRDKWATQRRRGDYGRRNLP